MKRMLFALIALTTAAFAQEDDGTVTVTGNRVSLRAAPDITAVLLDRAMKGDELVLKDNSNPDWVGVLPPDTVELWVNSEYISGDRVVPEQLNVRSGPSLNHGVVGVITNGQEVAVRGETADWTRIAPPPQTTVWISRSYVDVKIPEPVKPAEPAEAVVEIEETEAPEQVATVTEPTVQEVVAAAATQEEDSGRLKPDYTKVQGVEKHFDGILQPTDSMLYKLTDPGFNDMTICYVCGNKAQMEAYARLPLKLTGKVYWADGLGFPIMVPAKIQVLNKLPAD
ncbi:MAG: SH3 domain-containing protein [Kiritimatiellales bacterium]